MPLGCMTFRSHSKILGGPWVISGNYWKSLGHLRKILGKVRVNFKIFGRSLGHTLKPKTTKRNHRNERNNRDDRNKHTLFENDCCAALGVCHA